MTVFIPWLPSRMSVTFRWKTSVTQMEDGTEHRSSTYNHPEVLFRLEYQMIGDGDDQVDFTAERRDLRGQLISSPSERFSIPLRYEGSNLLEFAASGTDVIALSLPRTLDWLAAGRTIYIEYGDDESGFEAVVDSIATVGDIVEVTLVDPLPEDVTEDFVVCPVVEIQQDAKQVLGKYRADNTAEADDIGTWTISGAMQTFYMYNQGTGVTTTTYEGLLVFALPAVQNSDDQMGEEFDSGLTMIGDLALDAVTLFPKSLVRRDLEFTVEDVDVWRYFKKLMFTAHGQRMPFFRPTFRPDIFLSAQPSSPTTSLLVEDQPDYRDWFADSHAFRRLYLAMSDGSHDIVAVSSVTDNLDGTLTLNLTQSYSRGSDTITNISFLETVRLASDDVGLTCANGTSVIRLETLTGDWKQIPS